MKPLLVMAGTGTDVGKTVCTAALLRAMRQHGLAAQAVKPVQTGVPPEQAYTSPLADAPVYEAALADVPPVPGLVAAAVLHCFPLPASPYLAAQNAGTSLDVASLARSIRTHVDSMRDKAEILLLECAGGLMVPLNRRESMLDLLAVLDASIVLTGKNELGCLNHFLLSADAIAQHGLALSGICLTPGGAGEPCVLRDNTDFLRQHFPDVPLVELPQLPVPTTAKDWQRAADSLDPLVTHIREHIVPSCCQANRASDELVARDHRTIWHPYASALALPPLAVAKRSHANRIVLEDGWELIDGMSSWWAAIHGYNHPHIVQALQHQAGRMPHVMFGGMTHRPAVTLAERLLNHMPLGLSRVFFADSGSVSVEVALKMALQYQLGRGEHQRTRFLAPRGGYHGDTMGAMSVCDPETGMHSLFKGMLATQLFLPRPDCPFGGRFDTPFNLTSLEPAREMFRDHGEDIAAVILEPVVQGAGGMWFYHPHYLRGLRELCDQYGALLIFDEIATGFGRTGKFFAAEWADVAPDILCCGKGLTGGVMTLAATVCNDKVATGICQNGLPFMHGPTFMANPLACAAANASLDILEEHCWPAQIASLEAALHKGLARCRNLPGVADVRVLGGIGVVETEKPVDTATLQPFFVEHGVWIRPFARLIYLMPPYISPDDDVKTLCEAVYQCLLNIPPR